MKTRYHSLLLLFLLPLFLWASPSKERIKSAENFCTSKNYNQEFCILVDMSIHSGKKRLYLWSFTEQKVLLSALCSHGCCEWMWSDDESREAPTFSNVPNSHCSSLGKFKIGKRGASSWGIRVT